MNQPTEQPPIPVRLLEEQEKVQADKFDKRSLDEYTRYIFLGGLFRDRQTSEVEQFIDTHTANKIEDINDLLLTLLQKLNRPVQWVDMGGGYGLAQRQMATDETLHSLVRATNVDLFKHEVSDLSDKEKDHLTKKYPGILDPLNSPQFICANIETVILPEQADLITSVEVVQYLDNPLLAVANWYNQLAPNGLLIISTEHTWSGWIRSEGAVFQGEDHPLVPFFEELEANDIHFSFSRDSFRPDHPLPTNLYRGFCNLIIKKSPDTKINLVTPTTDIWVNPHGYKAIYYEKHPRVIEVVHT